MNANSNQPNDDTIRQLSEYVDGTLDPKAAVELMRRVATDRALQKELEALRAADALIKTNQDEMPEIDWDSFSNSVRKRIEKSSKNQKPRSRNLIFPIWRPLAAAAILAMSFTAFLMVDRNTNAPTTTLSNAGVSVSVERPAADGHESHGQVVASVSRDRPADLAMIDSEFVGPPYRERSILVATGLN